MILTISSDDGLRDEMEQNLGGIEIPGKKIDHFRCFYFGLQIGRTDFPGRSIYYLDVRDHYIGEK